MQNISGTIGYDVWANRKGTKKRNINVIQNELIKKHQINYICKYLEEYSFH